MLPIKIKNITLCFLMILSGLCYAQSKSINGKITGANNLPIDGVAIVLYDAAKNIVTYTITNELGIYNMEAAIQENYVLEVTHISYLKQTRIITGEDVAKTSLSIDFKLEENTASLDEVIIISSNEVKDTVRLDLDKLKLYEDSNLQEILEKIPNFRLNDDGAIIYKGKNIDKILVNKKPSFENQNSIALESIEKSIIDGISVINNYNDAFTLDFDENKETVLNIDTKDDFKNILNGSVEGKIGYQDKYEFKGKGFLFSKNLNAFLTNNTNNIGKTTITSNEIRSIFKEGLPISSYHEESLGRLFATNENLQKDFFTSTNLTLRNQTQRLKTAGIFYYIAPNRVNSVVQNVSTLDNISLLNTIDETKAKTQSFLSAISIAYKISNKSILSYNLNVDYVNNRNKSTVENELFDNGTPNGINTTFSNNNNNIFSLYHQVLFTNKLQENLILEAKGAYFSEGTKLLNDYSIQQNMSITDNAQNYKFDKNQAQATIAIKYKFSDTFIPRISANYYRTQEELKDRNLNNSMIIRRERDSYFVNIEAKGNGVTKGLDYDFNIGLNPFTNRLVTNNTEESHIFVPIKASLNYENKLNRYYIDYSRSRDFNDIFSGVNTIQPFNSIWNGNSLLPLEFNTSSTVKASYNYNNIFDGEAFSISVTHSTDKNSLQRNFIAQQNGISEFNLFLADKSNTLKASSYYSKVLSPLKYPTKIGVFVNYNQVKYPSIIAQQEVDVLTRVISPSVRVQTITDNLLNFEFSSKISFSSDEVVNTTYNATYTRNSFAVLLKNKIWKGNITFLYDNNHINNVTYSRKNLNLGLSYTKNNMVFSMEARHVGELLSFFENDAYNSQFIISNGITNTIVNNESLNYIILGIKFKL